MCGRREYAHVNELLKPSPLAPAGAGLHPEGGPVKLAKVVLVAASCLMAWLRIGGVRSQPFQAASHLWVGALIGAQLLGLYALSWVAAPPGRARLRSLLILMLVIAFVLSILVELPMFLIQKFG